MIFNKEFSKKILSILLLFIVVFLIYFIRIKNSIVSIDTESFINNPKEIIYSWYSIGRFSLGIYIELFNLLPLNIVFNNIISLIIYTVSVLLFVNSLNNKQDNKKSFLMSLMILSSPLLAEQYAFTLQNIEVAISYFLLIIVMIFIKKVIYNKKYIYFIFLPLLILVFGTYQSFYMMYITLAIIYYIDNFDEKLDFKKQLKIIMFYIGILIVSGILTTLTGNVINEFLSIEKTGYLTSQMNWFNGNFTKGVLCSGYYFVKVLLGLGIDDNLGYLILLIIIFLYLKNECKDKKNIYKIALIGLMFSPFLISFMFGTVTFSRAQFSIPIIMSYLYGKFFENKKIYIIFICIILSQMVSTIYLFGIDQERYNNDIKLINYVDNIKNKENLPIIFINKVDYEKTIKGEVLGKTFFNWDYKSNRLSNDRINGIMKVNGVKLKIPTIEQINEVKENEKLYKKLVNYTDNYIVVNLDFYKKN